MTSIIAVFVILGIVLLRRILGRMAAATKSTQRSEEEANAHRDADQIVARAKAQAQEIVLEAEAKAKKVSAEARADTEQEIRSLKEDLRPIREDLERREIRLAEREHPTAGLVMLVPHYLGDTAFPGAAVAALEAITSATGLVVPTDELREENRLFLAKVEEQVAGNHELQRLIETLEQRHDSYIRDNPLPSRFADPSGNLPTADQIA